MREVLNHGKVLTDNALIGKIKDYYPLKLFTLHNVELLMNNGKTGVALYLLPYSLWLPAITIE